LGTLYVLLLTFLNPRVLATETINVEGFPVSAPVTITRDAAGIPTIAATSKSGGYAGLCYAMAQDRLWQMDFLRRVGQGRLAEIFGNDPDGTTVGGDIFNRTLGLAQLARTKFDAASPNGKLALTACSVGINLWIKKAKADRSLPMEFNALGYEPEWWRPEDSVTVYAALVSGLDQTTAFTKLDRAILGSILGPDAASKLVIDQLDGLSLFDRQGRFNNPRIFLHDVIGAPMMPAGLTQRRFDMSLASFTHVIGGKPQGARAVELLKAARSAYGGRRLPPPATNLLLVGGSHTATGKPIFENDFHLANFTPSAIYLARLNIAGEFNLKGKFVPSLPAAIAGRNDDLVWGVTFALLDAADFYLERLNSAGDQVRYRNSFVPVQSRTEVIRIAGAAPINITVRVTPHGPIISDAIPALQQFGTLSFQTTYAKPEWVFDGLFDLHAARDIGQFRRALRRQSVGLNYAIADARHGRGNIAYQLAGLAPQRNIENTFVPVRGDDGSHEWTFFANQSQLPYALNPSAGFIAVNNNRIVPEDYAPGGTPIYLSRYGDQAFRTKRAVQLTASRIDRGVPITFANMSAVATDSISAVTPALAKLFANAIAQAGFSAVTDPAKLARLQVMLRDLQTFDGNAAPESRAQVVLQTLLQVSLKNLIVDLFPTDPNLGQQLFISYTRDVFVNSRLLTMATLLTSPQAPFFGATGPGDAAQARNRAVIRALLETDDRLVTQLGADITGWRWGSVHALVSTHPLSQAIPLFSLPPAPFAGDSTTLNVGGYFSGTTPFSKGAQLLALSDADFAQRGGLFAVFLPDAIAAERVVWDVGNRRNDRGVLSTGQSGNPLSPHWSDMRAIYVNGGYIPF